MRRRWIVALGGALLLAVLAVLAGAPETPPPAVGAPPPLLAVPAAPPDVVTPEEPDELPEAVQRYLEANVYPPSSGRLEAGAVDLLFPNRRYEEPRPVREPTAGEPPVTSLLTTDRYFYTGDETAKVRLEVRRGRSPLGIVILEALAQPEGGSGAIGAPTPLTFFPEGEGLRADLSLDASMPEHHGPIQLRVRFRLEAEAVEESIRIFSTPATRIPARFTGSFQDYVRDGSLVVDVGVAVETAGFYRFDANFHDGAGEPVAWTVFKGELDEGGGSVPLEVFGKVLRDTGLEGPYQLGELRGYRFLEGAYPDRERMRDWEGRFETNAYGLEEFSEAIWESDQKSRMVELMLEDEARGISLDVPPTPTPE